MKRQQRGSAAPNQLIYMASLSIMGPQLRIMTCIAKALSLPFMIILLLQGGVAFGAGERFLGVQVSAHQQGIIIGEVVQGSPATRVVDTSSGQSMSLEPGDIIQSVNGVSVSNPSHFVQLIRTGPPVAAIGVWDVRNRLFRIVAAGVGPSNEVAAYLNQRSRDLEDRGTTDMPPAPTPPQGMSAGQRRAKIQMLETQISVLDRKIRDQEKSVRQYEEWGDERPGATNMMLQQSARNLLQAYEKQKMQLETQKARLESGM
jgi:hypothetical protein